MEKLGCLALRQAVTLAQHLKTAVDARAELFIYSVERSLRSWTSPLSANVRQLRQCKGSFPILPAVPITQATKTTIDEIPRPLVRMPLGAGMPTAAEVNFSNTNTPAADEDGRHLIQAREKCS